MSILNQSENTRSKRSPGSEIFICESSDVSWRLLLKVPKCMYTSAYIFNMGDTSGSPTGRSCSFEGAVFFVLSVGHLLSVFFQLILYVCSYSPAVLLSALHLHSLIPCCSLPIRKHSGLMVGLKLKYKVIRQWMHF